jgi:hypothetical protein
MKLRKYIKTTNKWNMLSQAVLLCPKPAEYLWGIVLTSVAENSNIHMEDKQSRYEAICDKIEATIKRNNDGEFKLDSTMVSLAFIILEDELSVKSQTTHREIPAPPKTRGYSFNK